MQGNDMISRINKMAKKSIFTADAMVDAIVRELGGLEKLAETVSDDFDGLTATARVNLVALLIRIKEKAEATENNDDLPVTDEQVKNCLADLASKRNGQAPEA
jgi:hypothetical protein